MEDSPPEAKPVYVTIMVTAKARRDLNEAVARRYGADAHGKKLLEATAAIEAHAAKLLAGANA